MEQVDTKVERHRWAGTNYKAFLDMDGVLTNFVEGAARAHNRPSPYSDAGSYGNFDMEKLWGISPEAFWTPTNNFAFWRDLEKMPDADELVRLVTNAFGEENIAILTSPSDLGECITAKRQWMKEYYPQFADRMIFTSAKEFLAGPNRVLIDDRDKNIDIFQKGGGRTLIVPRLWNREHYNADVAAAIVRARLGWTNEKAN